MNLYLVPAATAFVTAFLIVALMLRQRWHWALDHPNDRSLHSDPTPRSGGLAVMAGIIVAGAAASLVLERVPLAALGLAVALAGVSLADDRGGLPITARLGTHLAAAALFAAYLTDNGVVAAA